MEHIYGADNNHVRLYLLDLDGVSKIFYEEYLLLFSIKGAKALL